MKNRKVLSATHLKFIVIIAMTIDHIAYSFVQFGTPMFIIMRIIGRLTAPTMSFFIAEGLYHTKSKKIYLLRLLIFAVISQPFYYIVTYGSPVSALSFITHLNVLFNFALSIIIISVIHKYKSKLALYIIPLAMCIALSDLCDWSIFIPIWTAIFYFLRDKNRLKYIIFIAVSFCLVTMHNFDNITVLYFQYGVLLTPLLLYFYNGKRSNNHSPNLKKRMLEKWIFYLYYPLHLAIISIALNI